MSMNANNSDFVTQQQLLRRQMNSHDALNRRDSTSRWNNQQNNTHNRGGRGGRWHQQNSYDHRFYARLREPNVQTTATVGCPAQLINAEEMVKQFAAAQHHDGDDDFFESPSEVLPGVPGVGAGVQPAVAPLMSGKLDSTISSTQTSGQPPPLSYAAALGAAALTGATKTVNATITNIKNFDLHQFARDLQKAKLFEQVDAIQIYGARTNIELQMASTDAAVTLARVGLNTHGRHLSFEVERPPTISVSLLGVNVHLPNALVKEEMARFGEVVDVWEARHRLLHRVVRNGTRVVQFKTLSRPVPSNVTVFGRRVRAIYTGQAAHLAAWKRDTEDARQPAVDVATAGEGAQGGVPGVDFKVTSDQSGPIKPAETHPSPSLTGKAPLMDGAAVPDPPGASIPPTAVNPPKAPPPTKTPPPRKANTDTTGKPSTPSVSTVTDHHSVPASPPTPSLPAVPPPPTSPAASTSSAPVIAAAFTPLIASTPPIQVQPLSTTDVFIKTTSTAVHRSARQESSGVRSRSVSPPRSSPEESQDDTPPRIRRQRTTAFDKRIKPTNPLIDTYRNIDPAASAYETDNNMEVVPATEDCRSTATDDTMLVDRHRIPKRLHATDGTDDKTATVRKYSKQNLHDHFTTTAISRINVYTYLQKRTTDHTDRHQAFIDLGVATADLPTAHAWFLDLKFGKYQIIDKGRFSNTKSPTCKSLPAKKDGRKGLIQRWKTWSSTQEAVQTETMDGIVETIRIHITSLVSTSTTIRHS